MTELTGIGFQISQLLWRQIKLLRKTTDVSKIQLTIEPIVGKFEYKTPCQLDVAQWWKGLGMGWKSLGDMR